MFRRQCYFTGWYERATLKTRSYVPAENILWATNFPLATSTWPSTRDYLAHRMDGLPEDARRRILYENAAKLYSVQI